MVVFPVMHRGLLLAFVFSALGCAKPVDAVAPEISSPISQKLPRDLGTDVDQQIEISLPTVSYAVDSPGPEETRDLANSLDPDAVRALIQRLESLDGDGVIVCVPTDDTAFGECVFPLPETGP